MHSSASPSALAPEAQFRSAVGVTVHASPENALAAFRAQLAQIPAPFLNRFISVRAEPAGPGRSRLVLEYQTSRYWRLIRPTVNFVSWRLLRAAKRRAEYR